MTKVRSFMVVAVLVAAYGIPCAAEEPAVIAEEEEAPGKAGIDVLIGVPVLQHRFAQGSLPARDVTVIDSLKLVEQLGLSYTAADVLQIGFAAQFAQVITGAPPDLPSQLTDVRLIPSIMFRFEPFSLGLGALFSVRQDGINQFGFGVLPTITARMPIVGGLALLLQVQAPVFLHPEMTVGVQPMLGLSYEESAQ